LIIFLLICKFLSTKFIIQISTCMPKGIYIKKEIPSKLACGQILLFKIPEHVKDLVFQRGWFLSNLNFFMTKPIAALEGDVILISKNRLFINNKYFGQVKNNDKKGLPLPQISNHFKIPKNKIFVASMKDDSFDSRYFGLIDKKNVLAVVKPFVIFSRAHALRGHVSSDALRPLVPETL